jgi:8-oxo-dGTP diphosphatase
VGRFTEDDGEHADFEANHRRDAEDAEKIGELTEMIIVVAGVIESGGKILVCQRRCGDTFELMWEFPGGKLQAGETPAEGLARELREELGVEAKVGAELFRTQHRYAEFSDPIELIFLAATVDAREIRNNVFESMEWRATSAFGELNFLPADREFIALLARASVARQSD